MDDTQNFGMVASSDDILWFNIKAKEDLDLDEMYHIGDIRDVLVFEGKFFILANRYKDNI